MELSLSPGFPGDNNELFSFCLDASLPMPPGWYSFSGDDNALKWVNIEPLCHRET